MTRDEEIINAANEYVTKTHSPSTNEFQTAMNIAVVKAYIAAAKWADETHHEKCMDWLFDNFSENEHDGDYNYGQPYISSAFDTREEMLDSYRKVMEVE